MERKLVLLFTLILSTHVAYASGEMVTNDDKNQILSSIKDIEITDTLKKTSEYSKCAKEYSFDAAASEKDRSIGLKKAQDCFLAELKQTSNPEKLEELSNKLGLLQYGLVQSNSNKEIQSYLNDKLYEALTGINRKEKNEKDKLESMKYNKMKQVDQSLFIQLYKNQLGKNALAEISRFCFEKLRVTANSSQNQFDAHWKDYKGDTPINIQDVDDLGKPPFTTFSDTKDNKKIYQEIFSSIQGNFNPNKLSNFFLHCGKLITPLCDKFKAGKTADSSTSVTGVDVMTNGAAACLTQSRIQDFKKAIAATDLVIDDFRTLTEDEKIGMVLAIDGTKIHGSNKSDKGIDELTNLASSDVLLHSGSGSEEEKAEEECKAGNKEACEAFAITGDSLDKAKHNIELQMTFKREVEKKRVTELKKKNDGSLEKYLIANGYVSLLENDRYKDPNVDIEKEIGIAFEARKAALLLEINDKLGKRQVKKGDTAERITEAQDFGRDNAKSEKARMTQVVLFHNVITSFLKLEMEGSKEEGRNVKAWEKEEASLKAEGIQEDLFTDISKNNAGANKLKNSDGNMNFKLLDQFLK